MPVLPEAAPLLGTALLLLGVAFVGAEPEPEPQTDLAEIAVQASLA